MTLFVIEVRCFNVTGQQATLGCASGAGGSMPRAAAEYAREALTGDAGSVGRGIWITDAFEGAF